MIYRFVVVLVLGCMISGYVQVVQSAMEGTALVIDENGIVSGGRGLTPLMRAAIEGDSSLVEALIAQGASVDESGHKERTALIYAMIKDNSQIVQSLIYAGAEVNSCDSRGYTALMHAADFSAIKSLRLLLEAKADINPKDEYGMTAFMLASNNRNIRGMQELLAYGANGYEENVFGRTCLTQAVIHGKWDCVEVLLEVGVGFNTKNSKGETVLFFAIYNQWVDVVDELLARAGREFIDIPNEDGVTPLMQAVILGNERIVQVLIDAGADVNLFDFENKTALDQEIIIGDRKKIGELLRKYNAKTFAELSGQKSQFGASFWCFLPSLAVAVPFGLATLLAASSVLNAVPE